MDLLTLVTTILIALFTGYTFIAWKHRRWYFKIAKYVFPIYYICAGILVGYSLGSMIIWNKVKSFDPNYFRQVDEWINLYMPSIGWYILFGVVFLYMLFLHHVIWRIAYRKNTRKTYKKGRDNGKREFYK